MKAPTGTYTIQQTASLIGWGSQCLFKKLRQLKIIDTHKHPYPQYIKAGYLKVEMASWDHPTIGKQLYARTFVTVEGVEWIKKQINKEQAA